MSALANANASADADADAKAGGTVLLIDIGNTRLKWAWCGAHSRSE